MVRLGHSRAAARELAAGDRVGAPAPLEHDLALAFDLGLLSRKRILTSTMAPVADLSRTAILDISRHPGCQAAAWAEHGHSGRRVRQAPGNAVVTWAVLSRDLCINADASGALGQVTRRAGGTASSSGRQVRTGIPQVPPGQQRPATPLPPSLQPTGLVLHDQGSPFPGGHLGGTNKDCPP
jgi:hypothetical protein